MYREKEKAAGANGGGAINAVAGVQSPSFYQPEIDKSTLGFLGALWEGGAWGHWWTPNTGRFYTDKRTGEIKEGTQSIWFPIHRPAPIPNHWLAERNVYFGVHPTTEARRRYERSTIGTIGSVNAVFADFDLDKYGSMDAIFAHLETLPRYPSAVVQSGGGLHCYWLFSWPVPITDNTRQRFRDIQVAWVGLVGSDDACKDLARVLRVPGSRNWKADYAPDFPPVRLIEWRDARRVDLPVVEALVADRVAQIVADREGRQAEDAERTSEVAAGAARQLLEWCVKNAAGSSRHDKAYWLAGRLRAEGIEEWAAHSVLREFARRVSTPGTRQLDDKEMGGIIRHVYRGGPSANS